RASDARGKQREAKDSALVVFVLDASGSMGARRRMEATKGAVFSLLMNAYQSRDRVALISVRGAGATVMLPPTRSVELAHRRLAELPTGGRTPLWAGLDRAAELVAAARQREANVIPLLVAVTDGRANAPRGPLGPAEATIESARAFRSLGVRALVIDTEEGYVKLGLAHRLASELDADYVTLDHPDEATLTDSVRRATRALRDE
ncbi:MAG: VWA domain-containing protein, partial [Chloroflexi bacterium]|nr:VWA domain-containing protein [Chloroflexota bacterium]